MFETPDVKPPSPAELAVIAICFSALLIIGGIVGYGVSVISPPHTAEGVAQLRHYSGWSLVLGFFIGLAFWIVRRLTN